MIDGYATWPHYADYVYPVWVALPPRLRGVFYADMRTAAHVARRFAYQDSVIGHPEPSLERAIIVAGTVDLAHVRRRAVFINHGAGQTYAGDPRTADDEAYAGGRGRERVALFIEPNESAGDVSAASYDAAAVDVGPIVLDDWLSGARASRNGGVTFGVTAHHRHHTIPEQAPCIDLYVDDIRRAAFRLGVRLVATAHPRSEGIGRRRAERLGCLFVPFDEFVDAADVVLVDNSSMGPLFAALGRPVIWFNSPDYRRDVHHGGRFWDWTVGNPTVDLPGTDQTFEAMAEILGDFAADYPAGPLCDVFAEDHLDGRAAERAAAAIAARF